MTSLVVRKLIGGGVVNLERVQVICPACGQKVEAVAWDGQVKGYCAVAKRYVDFPVEAQPVPIDKHLTAETKAKISAIMKKRWQDPEYRAKQSAVQSVIRKRRWQDPEYRAKQSAARQHNKNGVASGGVGKG